MSLRQLIERRQFPRYQVLVAGFLLVGLLGYLDYLSGYEAGFSLVYVLPLLLATWMAGMTSGLILSVVAACVWLVADIAAGNAYSHPLVAGWNTLIRLGFFCVVTYLQGRLHQALLRAEHASRIDNLTGALTSGFFYECLDREIDRLGRYGRPLTVAYLDLDGFKAVNDNYGHLVGDRVLRVVADGAKSRLRKTDMIARMGGDEFALLCPETDEDSAQTVINGVIRRLGEEMRAGGWPVTFSVGVVTCHEAPAGSEELVKMADDSMYSVKLGKKDGVVYGSLGCAAADTPSCDEQTLLDALRDTSHLRETPARGAGRR
jgi:diguanylate cyclase (GGDEF)-like protein